MYLYMYTYVRTTTGYLPAPLHLATAIHAIHTYIPNYIYVYIYIYSVYILRTYSRYFNIVFK